MAGPLVNSRLVAKYTECNFVAITATPVFSSYQLATVSYRGNFVAFRNWKRRTRGVHRPARGSQTENASFSRYAPETP